MFQRPRFPTARLAVLSSLLLGACGTFSSQDGPSYAGDVITGQTETYQHPGENDFIDTAVEPTSTFGVDVDTASYSLMRRDLEAGRLPDKDGVRVEEYLNYFKYDDAPPTEAPLAVTLEGAPSPFGEGLSLLRIGLRARDVTETERKPANLVFLIDVSGSMQASNKLGLVKYALGHLVNRLQPTDTLGIVVYAGSDAVLLDPTPVSDKSSILDAIDALSAGGSTAGEAGIRRAYALAESAMRADGINRVVLCTDGDFNVGATGDELISIVESFRDRGIFLTTLGFGSGNYNDATMEQLADKGNGNYAYLDTPNEALRVLGENLVGTLQVVAKDAKLQIEFDPAAIKRYRLIGYENRLLENEDFENDAVDAGDVGAGHRVTALYEVERVAGSAAAQVAQVRLRYKQPEGDVSQEEVFPFPSAGFHAEFSSASKNLRWAAAVAEYAEILRASKHSSGADFAEVAALAGAALPDAPAAEHSEFLSLVEKARLLWQ